MSEPAMSDEHETDGQMMTVVIAVALPLVIVAGLVLVGLCF